MASENCLDCLIFCMWITIGVLIHH